VTPGRRYPIRMVFRFAKIDNSTPKKCRQPIFWAFTGSPAQALAVVFLTRKVPAFASRSRSPTKVWRRHMNHNPFMARAIQLSIDALHSGRGGPFGAVIVKDGKIVAEGANQVTSTNDPTAHAEIVAIRRACYKLGVFELKIANCTLRVNRVLCASAPSIGLVWRASISLILPKTPQDRFRRLVHLR
jgi:MafB19-like deaminase